MADRAYKVFPNVMFKVMSEGKPVGVTSYDVFSGKSVMLFGMPGAFTPYCDGLHLPGVLAEYDEIMSHGADLIACTSVNDIYVLDAWARKFGAADKILFLADGNGDFATALDLLVDLRHLHFGFRSKRYVMWIVDCEIKYLKIKDDPFTAQAVSAPTLMNIFSTWDTKPLPTSM